MVCATGLRFGRFRGCRNSAFDDQIRSYPNTRIMIHVLEGLSLLIFGVQVVKATLLSRKILNYALSTLKTIAEILVE